MGYAEEICTTRFVVGAPPLHRINRQSTPPFTMHKYMDDTTLTVPVQKGSSGSMQSKENQAVS